MKHLLVSLLALAACNQAGATSTSAVSGEDAGSGTGSGSATLPVDQIQRIVGAEGTVDNGVLDITIERKDIGEVKGPRGMTLTPAFQVQADLYFQPLGNGDAILNGDMALKESEVDPFIAALIQNGLVFQAFHQHTPTQPQIWFVHYRGVCDPISLAHSIRNAIDVTSTPLPQQMPANPTTPLDPQKLASILHGTATVGDEGVVTVAVPRQHGVVLGGVTIKPETGIANVIQFKPTGSGTGSGSGSAGANTADVVADFSMDSKEVQPTVKQMLVGNDWDQGCLYNQETDEQPQLYFDHMAKTGDAYELAAEIRAGLDLTDAQ
jgi:hypothetical protein